MTIPAKRWYDAITRRRSRRQFDGRPLPPETISLIDKICREFQPFPGVRATLLAGSCDGVFKGMVGSYGRIKGANACICFIGQEGDLHVNEKVGYTGEGIILEATALGLNTCWVGGFFRPEAAAALVRTVPGERVFAVTPVGQAAARESLEEKVMTAFGRTHRRRPLGDLVTGMIVRELPQWLMKALDAARIAPSAVNRQPWRFHVTPGAVTISTDNLDDTYKISKRLDCGIAMLHFEVAALSEGRAGTWALLDPPGVATWTTPGG